MKNSSKRKVISRSALVAKLATETRNVDRNFPPDRVVKDRIRKRIKFAVEVKGQLTLLPGDKFDYGEAEQWAIKHFGKENTGKESEEIKREIGRRAFGVLKSVVVKPTGIDSRPYLRLLSELLQYLPAETHPNVVRDLRKLFQRMLSELDGLKSACDGLKTEIQIANAKALRRISG